jgi:hypothetical protein
MTNWSNRGGASYAVNYYVFQTIDGGYARIPATIPDGTSNTIGVGERATNPPNGCVTVWGEDGQGTNCHAAVMYAGGVAPPLITGKPTQLTGQTYETTATTLIVGLMDGSVRSVGAGITITTWSNALNPADGNVLGPDW